MQTIDDLVRETEECLKNYREIQKRFPRATIEILPSGGSAPVSADVDANCFALSPRNEKGTLTIFAVPFRFFPDHGYRVFAPRSTWKNAVEVFDRVNQRRPDIIKDLIEIGWSE